MCERRFCKKIFGAGRDSAGGARVPLSPRFRTVAPFCVITTAWIAVSPPGALFFSPHPHTNARFVLLSPHPRRPAQVPPSLLACADEVIECRIDGCYANLSHLWRHRRQAGRAQRRMHQVRPQGPLKHPRRFLWSVGMASAWVDDLIYNSSRLSQ